MSKHNLITSDEEWRILFRLIEEAREAAKPKLSVEAAAKKAGMQRQQWYRIRTDRSGTKPDTLERMAAAVGCDLDELRQRARTEASIKSKKVPAAEKAALIVTDLARTPKYQEHAIVTLKAIYLLSKSVENEEAETGNDKDKRQHHRARRTPEKGQKAPKAAPAPREDNGTNEREKPIRKNGIAGR